jgi:hypothetical protein
MESVLFRGIRDILLIGFALAGLLAASQIPGYVQEYEQRLGGARDEATRLLAEFSAIAKKSGKNLSSYTAALVENENQTVSATGREILALSERETKIALHAREMAASSRFMKPVLMVKSGDREIIGATWKTYRHTLTLDPEFGAIGLGVGWFVYIILSAVIGAMIPPPRHRVRAEKLRRSRS